MTASLLGMKIQQFRIVDLLGRGGMGEVYAGYDDTLERRVALKTLHTENRLDPEAKARFLREARILSQLAHPGICQIFDFIETDAFDVLVLELIRGRNLREALKEGLGPREQVRIAQELTAVLIAAHAKGVIHRDLKPDNAMLTEEGRVKVLDFGLSRSVEGDETIAMNPARRFPPAPEVSADLRDDDATVRQEGPGHTVLLARTPGASSSGGRVLRTEVGTVMGTLDYMSPEQAQGLPVTPATDIYSLGLIFQEMFTGIAPYEDKPDSSFEARLQRASRGETVPVQGLDPDLTLLIERMKAHEPYLRPTAVEVGDRLTALEGKPGRKRKRIVITGSIAVLVLFSLGSTVQAVRIGRERTRANQEAEAAKKSLEFLRGIFEQVNPSGTQGPTITVKELLDHGRDRIGELQGQPLLQAKVQLMLGRLFNAFGLYADALPLLEQARTTFGSNPGADPADLATSLASLGNLLTDQENNARAEPLYLQALAIREQSLGPDHPEVASSLTLLGILYRNQGKFSDAESLYKRALAINERARGSGHRDVAKVLNGLSVIYIDQAQYSKAEPLLRRAVAIWEQALGPNHPDVASALCNLGNLISDQGRFAEAEPIYQRGVVILEKALGPDHPKVALHLGNLAVLYFDQGKCSEAEPLFKRSLAIGERALGPDHPDVARTLNNLADLQVKQGNILEAETSYRRALAIRKKALGPTHQDLPSSLCGLADVYASRGQYSGAIILYQQALAINEKNFGPDHPYVTTNLVNLAVLHQRSGEFHSVEPIRNRLLTTWDRIYGSRDAWPTAETYQFSRLEALRGAREEALQGLLRCWKKGYSEPGFATDKDFTVLRSDPRFQQLVAEVSKREGARKK